MDKLDIVKMDIDKLNPSEYNPRVISEQELNNLKKSIHEFGYLELIVYNKRTNRIISGHQRLKALKDLGETEVEVILVDLDEDQEKQANIAMNKISGDWQEDKLLTILQDLQSKDKLDLTGFNEKELNDLEYLVKKQENDNLEAEEDDYEVPEEPENIYNVKKGDIYLLGEKGHRLMCGDSTNKEDVDKLMNGKKVDLLLTDPPYGVDYSSKNEFLNKYDEGNRNQIAIINDNIGEYNEFFNKMLSNYKLHSNNYNAFYITISDQKLLPLLEEIKKLNLKQSQILCWKKNNHILGRQDYSNIHEFIVYGWSNHHKYYGGFCRTVIEIDRPVKSELHPTMKPIDLCALLIKNSSLEDNVVLDLFLGSGSTLIACEQLNRVCYGMELDEHYCSVIIDRYIKLKGDKEVFKLEGDNKIPIKEII